MDEHLAKDYWLRATPPLPFPLPCICRRSTKLKVSSPPSDIPRLFGLLFLCGFGLPVPEDVPLIIAGALIAKGSMTWLWAGILAWCGDHGWGWYLPVLDQLGGWGHARHEIADAPAVTSRRRGSIACIRMFDEYGVGVVGVGRLFAGIRGAMVICAGTIRYNFLTFIIADGLAAIVSGGLWMLLGHWLGQKLTAENVEHYKHWIIAGIDRAWRGISRVGALEAEI